MYKKLTLDLCRNTSCYIFYITLTTKINLAYMFATLNEKFYVVLELIKILAF